MNRRQKIIVSVTGIFLVLLLLVGLTYAYFLTNITGNNNPKSISVSTANLALVYGDGTGVITATNILPGTTLDAKTFTVTNQGNAATDYVVVIEDVSVTYASTVGDMVAGNTTTFESNDFVYTLTCVNEDGTDCTNQIKNETTFPINGGIVVSNSIEVEGVQSYTLTVIYRETGVDQSNDMNKSLNAKVNIKDIKAENPYKSDTTLLAYNIINNAMSVTEEEKSAGYAELVVSPPTKVGEELSGHMYNKMGSESATDSDMTVTTTYQEYYWTYATDYIIDTATGKFSLVNPKTCKYSDSGCISDLINLGTNIYVVSTHQSANSNSTNTAKTSTNLSEIARIIDAPSSSSESITLKYREVSSIPYSTESVISTAQDDYGTSYYYRGAIKNNYLEFNEMCWRIVRIEGDGAVKITLAAQKKCSEITSEDKISALIGQGSYGVDQNGHADYENNNTGGMKYKFSEWFNTNLTSVSNKLKKATVCIGDMTTKYDSDGNLLTDAQAEQNQYYRYDNSKRIYNEKTASLVCNEKGIRTSLTQIFPLTVDEVVFAGGKGADYNPIYYLSENALNSWWTLSPANFNGQLDFVDNVFTVTGTYLWGDYLNDYTCTYDFYYLRPAVSLISGTQIASGDGTKNNPYIVE